MEAVFIKILNMSITASWLILAVILIRFLLKKAPKSTRCILWALVGIRLVCPFSLESALSLIPSAVTVSPDILYAEEPAIRSGIDAFNSAVNPAISESFAPAAGNSITPMQTVTYVVSIVWLAGIAAMIVYSAVSYVRFRRRVAAAVMLQGNVWQSETVSTPFVLGLFRPRIYIPFHMNKDEIRYIVSHEAAHIKRRDHLVKPLAFLILTVHWFNPLIWLAYILLCKDIELACDERVIRNLGPVEKKAYSSVLLEYSAGRKLASGSPLAFGEVGVKQRIKNILRYKKPAFWIIILALVSCLVVAVCFLTNPKDTRSSFYRWAHELEADDISMAAMTQGFGVEKTQHDLSREEIINLVNIFHCIDDDNFQIRDHGMEMEDNHAFIKNTDGSEYLLRFSSEYPGSVTVRFDSETARTYSEEGTVWIDSPELVDYLLSLLPRPQAGTTGYVFARVVYMSPFSSYYPVDSTGCRYVLGEGSFTIEDEDTGEALESFTDIDSNWQAFTDAEWAILFSTADSIPDISEYETKWALELSDTYRLFEMDGELWLMQLSADGYAWSVYALTPGGGQ